MTIFTRAWDLHVAKCLGYGPVVDPRLAHPFGRTEAMPEHQWRVSQDVLQDLTDASPPAAGPNPKSGDDGTRRLFGWVVVVDRTLPLDSMLLERVV